jgi:hypothetical protein
MAHFSETFGLGKTQAELDFVDIDLNIDTQLFICPYAIQIRDDEWSAACGDLIRSFFNELLDQLRRGNMDRVYHLMGHLHEPNETYLGVSHADPRGRGVGDDKARMLADAIGNSRAFETGVLADISEAELFVHGIGRDTISDLTTNILRGKLAEYTANQCELHGIQLERTTGLGPAWNPVTRDWEAGAYQLPWHHRRPILLVPKFSVRRRLSIDSQEFYNHYMVEFLQEEYLNAAGALVQALKNGRRRVTKKSVKARHPFIKDDLAVFVRDHPEVLAQYKQVVGARGPLDNDDLDEGFDEAAFAQVLIERLREIPQGNDAATTYHSVATGICTFLFHPFLITPIKEFEEHQGRKRIDIKFSNAAEEGFFHTMLQAPQTRAISVFVECKNYTRNINNPELDQLSGRFGHQRGFFGFLLCRSMENRQRVVDRCRDSANDGRGFMIALEDIDLISLLEMVRGGNRRGIDRFLQDRFDEISH